jgi:putative ABC transport system ATP-binding protein
MDDPVIRVSGVTKRYGAGQGAVVALADVSLDVARGEFVALMGPSGSGKSTLLNVIAGLDVPDQGRVLLDGTELGGLADHELADLRLARIGFVFQAFNLIPALTVAENVAWPLEFAGHPRREVRRRTADALARVGVAGREARYPAELSGGEQQRVAIARAVATRPAIILADEPTGNLDSCTGGLVLDLLRTLCESAGVTVVIVTHNAQAAGFGDRTLLLHDGRIVRDLAAAASPPPIPATACTAER